MQYKTEQERKIARRESNRLAQQRHRANIRLVKKPLTTKSIKEVDLAKRYTESLYTECAKYPFSHSITLTNKNIVTLNMHNKAVEKLIKILVDEKHITNYVRTNEYTGNYHSHFVVQVVTPGFDIDAFLSKYWKTNGFFKVVPIYTDLHRHNAIKYCFKQIDVTSNRALIQSLADTWSICLVQSFEALREAKSALLEDYNADNVLTVKFRNISPDTRSEQ